MLEYFKTILLKVSFDGTLFEKELKKALRSLIMDEIVLLRTWCYAKFEKLHAPILNRCFQMVDA